ncbi:MAG: nucleoside 2-deoxyribosyltransferase domain-containing protein [Candidatus Riesia sp.]|nr:nucleoside 2-deoxyribosyltransferase domain-containing protein [Candidatus Riesia sp.]
MDRCVEYEKNYKFTTLFSGDSSPAESKLISIFLAGPTPRDMEKQSWRVFAASYLEQLEFEGLAYIPEPRNGNWDLIDKRDQIEWEQSKLSKADCISFWIPRAMSDMPGLTTNIEWGQWKASGKVVLGYPHSAEHMGYISYDASNLKIPKKTTLLSTMSAAIAKASTRALYKSVKRIGS